MKSKEDVDGNAQIKDDIFSSLINFQLITRFLAENKMFQFFNNQHFHFLSPPKSHFLFFEKYVLVGWKRTQFSA